MTLEPLNPGGTTGAETSDAGFLTPDAGPDTARADYSGANANAADLNDSSHDFDNVDNPDSDIADANVVDSQMRIIGRTSG